MEPMQDLCFLLCLLFVFSCSRVNGSVEGSNCENSGTSGICKLILNCPVALEALKKRHNHNLRRCGFQGFDEVVCCPQITSREPSIGISVDGPNQQNRFTKRKCEQACEDISNEIRPSIDFHIINGDDAEIGEFPHMAALGYEYDNGIHWDCGASLISSRYLLTAAHCIANINKVTPKKARFGVIQLNDTNSLDYDVMNVTINPKYDPTSKHNDIALVRLKKEIKIIEEIKIYPACLYLENNDPTGLIVTGWGKTSISSDDDRSNILQKARLVAMPLHDCNVSYFTRSSGSKTIVPTQMCAGSDFSDACWGDSGGPLQIPNKRGSYSVVGVISYGAGCGGKVPGVYTRVSKYLDWIESIVWP